MPTIYDKIRADLLSVLETYLGKYKLSNGTLVPSIWIGDPPAKMAVPGIECNIANPAHSSHLPLLANESNSERRFQVTLDLWTPKLIDPSSAIAPTTKSLTEIAELLYLKFNKIKSTGTIPATRTDPARMSFYIYQYFELVQADLST